MCLVLCDGEAKSWNLCHMISLIKISCIGRCLKSRTSFNVVVPSQGLICNQYFG